MDAIQTVVTETLEQKESELFLKAVGDLPESPKKTKKAKKAVGEKVETASAEKPVSKYAAKKAANKQDAPVTVPAPVVAVPVEPAADAALIAAIQASMVDLLGDKDMADLEEMTSMRAKARELKAKSSTIKVGELRQKAEQEAWHWENLIPREAERIILDEYKRMCKGNMDMLKVLEARFEDLRDAWYTRKGDPTKKEKFNALRMAVIAAYPGRRMAEQHEGNLERAKKVMAQFEANRDLQESLNNQANELFDLANLIAEEHGWEKTQPIAKEVVHKG